MLSDLPENPRVALLLIGNELLTGKIRDENGHFTTKLFRQHGITLCQIRVIGDDIEEIVAHLDQLRRQYDILVTSGGVGPTHDDCTMQAVANAVGRKLVTHDEFLEGLKKGYGDRFNSEVARMALLPEGATLVSENPRSWPLIRVANIFIMPGVPQLYRKKVSSLAAMIGKHPLVMRQVFINEDEAQIAAPLRLTDELFSQVAIGSYPVFTTSKFRVKLTFESAHTEDVDKAVEHFLQQIDSQIVVEDHE